MSSGQDGLATLLAKIETRDELVALSVSWVGEADGYFLQLDAFMSQPSSEHPSLNRQQLAFWRCGAWQNEPKEHVWPELQRQRTLCEQLAATLAVPLHFPPEPYPDDSRQAWWAMWDNPPSRSWHVHWDLCDTTHDGEQHTTGALDADGPTPGHAFAIAFGIAHQTAVGKRVLERRIEVWTNVAGHRVHAQQLRSIRAHCGSDTVPLLQAVDRGEMKLSAALRIAIDDHGLPFHEAALLVVDRFHSELSEGRTYMTVDAWARNEPGGDDMDTMLEGKLRYREVDDSD